MLAYKIQTLGNYPEESIQQSVTCLRSVTYVFQLQIHWAEGHLCLVHYVLFCSVWLEVCLNSTVGLLQTEHLTNGKHISIL